MIKLTATVHHADGTKDRVTEFVGDNIYVPETQILYLQEKYQSARITDLESEHFS